MDIDEQIKQIQQMSVISEQKKYCCEYLTEIEYMRKRNTKVYKIIFTLLTVAFYSVFAIIVLSFIGMFFCMFFHKISILQGLISVFVFNSFLLLLCIIFYILCVRMQIKKQTDLNRQYNALQADIIMLGLIYNLIVEEYDK